MKYKIIWDFFLEKLNNPYGVAALMGNMFVESTLIPTYLQGSYARKLGLNSQDYTEAVDNGSYKDFITDKAGYGLVQWTFWSRKESLYNYAKSLNASIGDLTMQLNFIWKELQSYKTVMDVLCTATDIREASDIVAKKYEQPEHQEEKYLQTRAQYGLMFFNRYASLNEGEILSKAVVKASTGKTVNLRLGAGKSFPIMTQIPIGTVVNVINQDDTWSMVSYKNECGYIMNQFLEFKEESSDEFVKVDKRILKSIRDLIDQMLKE